LQQSPTSILITGASAGLGRALALLYAEPGCTLGLMGRNAERLQVVAELCRARGARVETHACDLCAGGSGQDFIRAFGDARPLDLLIVNAGVFAGHRPERQMEDAAEIIAVLRTNLEAAILTIAAAVPLMRARRAGRIAIMGSLAALQPLADAPAYSASKAGLIAYGEALREYLEPDGVQVSLINPGHIETGQVAAHVGALPLIASAETAAARIKRGLERGQEHIAFPRRLLWAIRAGRLLPWRLRAHLGRSQRFEVDRS
jgi:short-subunit dehydrogenase